MAAAPFNPMRGSVSYKDGSAQAREAWGDEWKKKEVVYEWSNGRKFEDSGANHGIYTPETP